MNIKRHFHLADNRNLCNNKCAKIQPIYDITNKNLVQFGIFAQNLSIDESMVPYFGRHSAKMFIKAKPIRFGYKIWTLCSSDGYPFHLEIYTGRDPDRTRGPGETAIMKKLEILETPSDHVIYFDNFFSSYDLFRELSEKGIRATGTVRINRTNKCTLFKDVIKKSDRGTFDYKSDGNVLFCTWKDSSVVSIGTNFDSVFPFHSCSRYSVSQRKKVSIQQPNLIRNYNMNMGGVDVYDKLLSSYRPTIRGKKWWWNLFINALNTLTIASWKAFNKLHPNETLSHIQFLRIITQCLVKKGKLLLLRPMHGRGVPKVSDIRKDGVGHHLKPCKQGRCVYCMKNTRLMCSKCQKRLHLNCSADFHK